MLREKLMTGERMGNPRDSQTAVDLDMILGAAGLFGVGEFYLGKRLRSAGFLALTGVLYTCLACAIAIPSLGFVWGYLPATWGVGYCLLIFDIFRLSDKLEGT